MYSSNIPRCQHIKVNGTQCGSPAVRDRRFCFFHKKWHDQRIVINSAQARQSPPTLDLPVLEDANSIQVALMQVMRLLISHQIDHKTAGLLLYALQTASFNLPRTDFEPVVKTKIVIDPTRVDETALGDPQWQNEDFENPEENNEEAEEEAENGHLEIQAMAAPNPRSDRRLACPARKRRSNPSTSSFGMDFRTGVAPTTAELRSAGQASRLSLRGLCWRSMVHITRPFECAKKMGRAATPTRSG